MSDRSRREARRERTVVSARDWIDQHGSGGWTSLNIPEGAKLFKADREEDRYFDFVPFITGEGNPQCPPDRLYFQRTYWCHRNIGPNNETYICLAKTFGERCPVCEHRVELDRNTDRGDKQAQAEIVALLAQERQLYNIVDVTTRESEEIGVQIWDISWHLFGKFLKAKIDRSRREDEYDLFADPDNGFTLKLGFLKRKIGERGQPFYEASDIEFHRRKDPLLDKYLDQAYCLDKVPKHVSYDKLRSVFLQLPSDENGGNNERDAGRDDRRDDRGGDRRGGGGREGRRDERDERPAPRDDDRGRSGGRERDRDDRGERDDRGRNDRGRDDNRRGERDDGGRPGERAAPERSRSDDREEPRGRPERDSDEPRGRDEERPVRRGRTGDNGKDEKEVAPAKGGRAKTAKEAGISAGTFVTWKGQEYEVTRVSEDGTSLTIEHENGDQERGIAPGDVEKVQTSDAKEEPKGRRGR